MLSGLGFPAGSDQLFRKVAPFLVVAVVVAIFLHRRQQHGPQRGPGFDRVMFGDGDNSPHGGNRDVEAAVPLAAAENYSVHRGVPTATPIKPHNQFDR